MKGTYPKRISACHLACSRCIYFSEDDPDIYYCDLHCTEFPGVCVHYAQSKEVNNGMSDE